MALTPGQVNFEAFMQGLEPPGKMPWQWLGAAEQAAWEAAARAVLVPQTAGDTDCPVCGACAMGTRPPGLTADGDVHRDMGCVDCGATWVNVYTFSAVAYVETESPLPNPTPEDPTR